MDTFISTLVKQAQPLITGTRNGEPCGRSAAWSSVVPTKPSSRPSEVLLAVADGRIAIGTVHAVGGSYVAVDARDHIIGRFPDERTAIRALLRLKRAGGDRNG